MGAGRDIIEILRQVSTTTPAPDVASDDIKNIALQAVRLPSTLSRSQIEKLGLAVLLHARRQTP